MMSIKSAASRASKAKAMCCAGDKVSKDMMARKVGSSRTKVSIDTKDMTK